MFKTLNKILITHSSFVIISSESVKAALLLYTCAILSAIRSFSFILLSVIRSFSFILLSVIRSESGRVALVKDDRWSI